MRVLIVDDIPETRDHVNKLLETEGFEVAGMASTGREAVQEAIKLVPDVVLIDILMPDGYGIEATEKILAVVPEVRVVMMSILGETENLRRSMLAGASDYLVKPFSADELRSALDPLGSVPLDRRRELTPADARQAGIGRRETSTAGLAMAEASDAGTTAVSTVFELLQVDAQWSQRDSRGFTWWPYQYAQSVWADPAIDDDGIVVCRLHAESDLLRDVTIDDNLLRTVSLMNSMSVTSALVADPEARTLRYAASFWVHDGTVDWAARLFASVVSIQAADAQSQGEMLSAMLGGIPATTSHPTSGVRGQPDDMLGIIRPVVEASASRSVWAGAEMAAAVQVLNEARMTVLATGGPSGLTAEFRHPLGTSMMQATTNEPHPTLGNGMLIHLSLPSRITEPHGSRWAADMNRREQRRIDMTPLPSRAHALGSWVVMNETATFVSFFPNLVRNPAGGDLINILLWSANRAQSGAPSHMMTTTVAGFPPVTDRQGDDRAPRDGRAPNAGPPIAPPQPGDHFAMSDDYGPMTLYRMDVDGWWRYKGEQNTWAKDEVQWFPSLMLERDRMEAVAADMLPTLIAEISRRSGATTPWPALSDETPPASRREPEPGFDYYFETWHGQPSRLARRSPGGRWDLWLERYGGWYELANQTLGATIPERAADPADEEWWALRPYRVPETALYLDDLERRSDIQHAHLLAGQGRTVDEIGLETGRSRDWLKWVAGFV